jgi:hypothetical protein
MELVSYEIQVLNTKDVTLRPNIIHSYCAVWCKVLYTCKLSPRALKYIWQPIDGAAVDKISLISVGLVFPQQSLGCQNGLKG